jgi:hypothetical protein
MALPYLKESNEEMTGENRGQGTGLAKVTCNLMHIILQECTSLKLV